MAYEIPVTQARAELAELINRVVYGGEHVVVTRSAELRDALGAMHERGESELHAATLARALRVLDGERRAALVGLPARPGG
jgi:antitoxin (DNA-binding transcriptional repressor) of toxin-antitoxin stability system